MSQSPTGAVRGQLAIPAGADRDSRWDLVERVCNSSQLRRSARLRQLLVYLCHRAWTDCAEETHEYNIGVDVFDRPRTYDPAQDTIVRVQASQLRKRLEQYFATEGRDEPHLLEVPKGAYVPVVRARPETVAEVESPAPIENVRVVRDRRLAWVLGAACLLLAIACAVLLFREFQPARAEPESATPALRRFWSAFSTGGRQTFVVVADSAFSAIQDALRRPIGLNEYVLRSYRNDLKRPDLDPDMKDMVAYLMERRYTSLADVMFIRRLSLASVLEPSKTNIVFARDHNLRAFHESNHVLVGSRRAVPWVDLFADSLDFHFVYDEATRRIVVENKRPLPNEPKRFELRNQGLAGGESFSVIACLPNLGRTGYVLILSGQEVSGTEAAGNLVTSEVLLKSLLDRLPKKAEGELPYFEALLHTRHVEYTTQGFDVLALHMH